ncbi:hypothetical protein BJ085DRAFT_5609, partial [Dimargaris cristalligena]
AGSEEGCRSLYVGNLDPRVTEDMLRDIFNTLGKVQSVKLIADRNFANQGLNYGFVEFSDHQAAEQALIMNGRSVFDKEIKVNWAFASSVSFREDTSNHHHIFVGDLGPEVNDQILQKAFGVFGSMSDARVMWDAQSGKTRGFGFVAYREKTDAEQAINTMNGEWIGTRAIRVNWANQKGAASSFHRAHPGQLSYESVVTRTPYYNTTVYLGNMAPQTTPDQVTSLLQQYGYIVNTRFQFDRGYAFIKMDTHENAAAAIATLNGTVLNGRPLKCSWGKDRP